MFVGTILVMALLVALLAAQIRSASGWRSAVLFAASAAALGGGAWMVLARSTAPGPPPEDPAASKPVTAQTCMRCHESHYASWHRTYHRTMTREATPENVKGSFDGVPGEFLGATVRMVQDKARFLMNVEFPDRESQKKAGLGLKFANVEGPLRLSFAVDRLIGSHRVQQLLHRDKIGRYLRLPMAYHMAEKRWLHISGRFLVADDGQFFSNFAVWNNNCLYCHNTRPAQNPVALAQGPPSFNTTVSELGISCEACHGAGERHVATHQNPLNRLTQRYADQADPTIINPAKLSVERSVDVCAHCHGGAMPRYKEWNRGSLADPYLAGRDLKRFWHLPFSDLDRKSLRQGTDSPDPGSCCDLPRPHHPEALDGRFWPDGTPLSTAVEYPGMAMSACYQQGRGKLTCLTCHSMHQSDPKQQVKESMRTNAACYQCHETYRDKLAQHTHHAADSSGSLCYNCHMARQTYGLLAAHPTHRISIPHVRESLGTGKPHACNLCHLDKSLGWTQDQLGRWYGTKPEALPDDERQVASSVLGLLQGDARTRAVFAGAFVWPPALEASGRDWAGPLMTRVLDIDRYQVVRYTAHKALQSLLGTAADDYDYQAPAATRADQVRALRARLARPRPDPARYPFLPLNAEGMWQDDVIDRLLQARKDPDVAIKE